MTEIEIVNLGERRNLMNHILTVVDNLRNMKAVELNIKYCSDDNQYEGYLEIEERGIYCYDITIDDCNIIIIKGWDNL